MFLFDFLSAPSKRLGDQAKEPAASRKLSHRLHRESPEPGVECRGRSVWGFQEEVVFFFKTQSRGKPQILVIWYWDVPLEVRIKG